MQHRCHYRQPPPLTAPAYSTANRWRYLLTDAITTTAPAAVLSRAPLSLDSCSTPPNHQLLRRAAPPLHPAIAIDAAAVRRAVIEQQAVLLVVLHCRRRCCCRADFVICCRPAVADLVRRITNCSPLPPAFADAAALAAVLPLHRRRRQARQHCATGCQHLPAHSQICAVASCCRYSSSCTIQLFILFI